MQKLVPKNDVELIDYENFKKEFGDDGNKLIIGLKSPNIFKEKVSQ
jgi:predicted RND superfamily exporter protein